MYRTSCPVGDSFTKAVRTWRYHLWLIPLQLYAVYDILLIGYSRILEGDHWFMEYDKYVVHPHLLCSAISLNESKTCAEKPKLP
ncbi:hypothetical protein ccbrp13_23540 [Ktedonobacteria bacterium brp13]|nr:hypothetical protein ccbrp13_23540 [Ktedonobacteria bacterium brp13]